jgi:hypothetical protein
MFAYLSDCNHITITIVTIERRLNLTEVIDILPVLYRTGYSVLGMHRILFSPDIRLIQKPGKGRIPDIWPDTWPYNYILL